MLSAAISQCFREGKLTQETPVVLPPKTPSRVDWFTRTEAAMLLRGALVENKARLHLPLFLLIAMHTGHRAADHGDHLVVLDETGGEGPRLVASPPSS